MLQILIFFTLLLPQEVGFLQQELENVALPLVLRISGGELPECLQRKEYAVELGKGRRWGSKVVFEGKKIQRGSYLPFLPKCLFLLGQRKNVKLFENTGFKKRL